MVTEATTVTMEMPISMAMLKGLCLSEVAQLGELGPCHDRGIPLPSYCARTAVEM
jgi:hypothetical protein